MKKSWCILILGISCIWGFNPDYDCIVVGSSPISMIEAIYQKYLGNRVLIVEKGNECGGAWKRITVFGIPHIDLGCHKIEGSEEVTNFLRDYLGCKMIVQPSKKPLIKGCGLYPSQGCYELISHLEYIVRRLDIELSLNSDLKSFFIHEDQSYIEALINNCRTTAKKIILTQSSQVHIENPEFRINQSRQIIVQYPHLYLLIEDSMPYQFSYAELEIPGVSRAMNMTPFIKPYLDNQQLIILQLYDDSYLSLEKQNYFLSELKKLQLLSSNALLIDSESYIFEQAHLNKSYRNRLQTKSSDLVEILDTKYLRSMSSYLHKWKQVMKPWNEIIN